MKTITLTDIPDDLHAQLEQQAAAGFRSVGQEVMARLQRSFDLEDRFSTDQVNRLIQQAVESGPEKPLTPDVFESARAAARERFAAKHQAA